MSGHLVIALVMFIIWLSIFSYTMVWRIAMLTGLHISRIIIKAWMSFEISVIYVSTRRHWDYTTLRHFCITWCEAESCTVRIMQTCGTISMPTGRHVDNDFIHFENKTWYLGIYLTFYVTFLDLWTKIAQLRWNCWCILKRVGWYLQLINF
jgi:hypothetical protein